MFVTVVYEQATDKAVHPLFVGLLIDHPGLDLTELKTVQPKRQDLIGPAPSSFTTFRYKTKEVYVPNKMLELKLVNEWCRHATRLEDWQLGLVELVLIADVQGEFWTEFKDGVLQYVKTGESIWLPDSKTWEMARRLAHKPGRPRYKR